MTQEILCRKDISTTAKLLYARMSGFEEYFESCATAGELLGKSEETIKKAKQELEKKGLIECIKNTGRGKVYRVRLDKIYQPDGYKSTSQSGRKLPPYNKEENKEENNSNNKLLEGTSAEKPIQCQIVKMEKETYGNEDINWAFEKFKEVFGYEMKQTKQNRFAVYNFLRSKTKGKDWLENMIKLWYQSREDKYSCRISDFADLQQKQNSLMEWGQRKAMENKKCDIIDLNEI